MNFIYQFFKFHQLLIEILIIFNIYIINYYFIYSMGSKGISKKLLSYAFSEVSNNIHWSGVGTGEDYYLSEVINLSNIRLSRFNCR